MFCTKGRCLDEAGRLRVDLQPNVLELEQTLLEVHWQLCRCNRMHLPMQAGGVDNCGWHNAWHTTSCATVSVAGAVRSAIQRQSKADRSNPACSLYAAATMGLRTHSTHGAHLEAEDVVDGDGQLVVELPRRARSVGYELLFAHKLRVRAVQCRCVAWA